VPAAVDLLVAMAKDRSVSLARPDHGISEPSALRRAGSILAAGLLRVETGLRRHVGS
jgi:hypothetical protein